MNIFVAGIHGVGKTFIATRAAPLINMTHTSASKLIKEERALASWGVDKRVTDVDANQIALASAVQRHNESGLRLLLDGHFVLKGENNDFILLDSRVFESLNLNGVLLVEEDVNIVLERLSNRDGQIYSFDDTENFMECERIQAQKICGVLNIPLVILASPTLEEFILKSIFLNKSCLK